ncbi:MAG TPA: nucleotidyltransferase family protein [Bryobacteraceae bacterium]|jgi:hypothetical protein|nr:nucleotidyltransferase family protein [Bryobacteraceae bacterium]
MPINLRHDDPHYRFLANTLSRRPAEARRQLAANGWNWHKLARIAADEAVLSALHSHLSDLQIFSELPEDIRDFLASYAQINAVRNRQVLEELESHAVLLNSAGIKPVVLKGLAFLLTGVYANQADRLLLDIDLLVPESQLNQAYGLFLRQGLQPENRDPLAFARHHIPALRHPNRITLELHRQLSKVSEPVLLSPEQVIARARPFQLGKATVRIPHPDDLMVHLVVHSQLHHGYSHRIWPPLRAQYDLLLLQKRFTNELNWPSIRARFEKIHKAALLDLHLLQIRNTLELEPPYAIPLCTATKLRRLHRRILWRTPPIRFLDPVFLFQSIFRNRFDLASKLLRSTTGRNFLLTLPFRPFLYRKLISSFQK